MNIETEMGKVIFEVPYEQFKTRVTTEEAIKPLSLAVEIVLIIVLILLYLVFPYYFNNFTWKHYREILLPSIFAVLGGILVYIDYLFSKELNRFAIYEKGISPPMKPLKKRLKKDFFVSYSEIKKIKLTVKVDTNPPHFRCTLSLIDDTKINIINENFVEPIFVDRENIVKVYHILKNIKRQLEKQENILKRKNNEDIILPSKLLLYDYPK